MKPKGPTKTGYMKTQRRS